MLYTIAMCDKCGKTEILAYASGVGTARHLARKRGWSVSKKVGEHDRTLCPNCRRPRKMKMNGETKK